MSEGSLSTDEEEEERELDGSQARRSATVEQRSGHSPPSNFPVCHVVPIGKSKIHF